MGCRGLQWSFGEVSEAFYGDVMRTVYGDTIRTVYGDVMRTVYCFTHNHTVLIGALTHSTHNVQVAAYTNTTYAHILTARSVRAFHPLQSRHK